VSLFPAHPLEAAMTELEMKDDAETEDFADALSDEALDREEGGTKMICFSGPGMTRN